MKTILNIKKNTILKINPLNSSKSLNNINSIKSNKLFFLQKNIVFNFGRILNNPQINKTNLFNKENYKKIQKQMKRNERNEEKEESDLEIS